MNILVVEDMGQSIFIFKNFLKDHSLKFCESEKTLYENLGKYNFDLIIMDIGLPGSKSGLELIKELKNSETYKKIPIICITVHSFYKDDAINAGADIFLVKPFTKSELNLAIDKSTRTNI